MMRSGFFRLSVSSTLLHGPWPLWLFCALLTIQRARAQDTLSANPGNPEVVIVTELGKIEVLLDSAKAPLTVSNFLRYVDAKMYNNGRFMRTVTLKNQPRDKVKIEVVQADIDSLREDEKFEPIKLESTAVTRILHRDGTISMARGGPKTATSSFFICINDQPDLNYGGNRNPDGYGFAAFGRVTKGMDVVRKIHESPAVGQSLKPAIKIFSITRKLP